jgi:transposase
VAGARSKARAEGRTVVWVDESGFYLLPAVVWTDAPTGRTPVLRVPLTRDHLSAISALTPDNRLFLLVQDRAIRGPDVVRFLRHLLRHLPGRLLVIWDRSPTHRGRAVAAFLAAGGADRVHLEYLPAYAPELNPDEGVWRYLKRVELRNGCCPTLWHLRGELRNAAARLRRTPQVIQACIRRAGCAAAGPAPRSVAHRPHELRPGDSEPGLAVRRLDAPGPVGRNDDDLPAVRPDLTADELAADLDGHAVRGLRR